MTNLYVSAMVRSSPICEYSFDSLGKVPVRDFKYESSILTKGDAAEEKCIVESLGFNKKSSAFVKISAAS
jgi:hypothetical protein